MIEVKRLSTINDISSENWNNLLFQSETNIIFLTYEWIKTWWETIGSDREILLLATYDSDTLIGLAPLMISVKKRGFSTCKLIQFLGEGDSDYCDFICSAEIKPEFIKIIFGFLKSNANVWSSISLGAIPEESSTLELIRQSARDINLKTLDHYPKECFAMVIAGNEDFARHKANRKGVKGRYHFLRNHGKPEFLQFNTPDHVMKEMDRFFQYHEDRRLLCGDKSKFHSLKMSEFYKLIVETTSSKGWFRFDILKYNDEPIYYHYGFNYNNKISLYTFSMNMEFYKRSPGMVMMKFLIEDCLDKKISEIDFARGSEEYKQWFSNETRKIRRIDIFKNATDYTFARRQQETKRFLKIKTPALYRFIKAAAGKSTYTSLINAVVHTIRRNGILRVTSRIASIALSKIYTSMKIIGFRMVLSERDVNWTHGDFTIREGDFEDLKIIVKDYSELMQQKLLISWFERLKNNHKLYVVEMDNKIVHHSWSTVTQDVYLPELDFTYRLPREMCYMYHSWTMPGYRGHGIYTAVLRYVADRAAESGAQELLGYVFAKNFVAHKGIKKTGALPFVGIQMTRILFWKWFRTFLYENEFTELVQ